jgi:YD repeat-containing protein
VKKNLELAIGKAMAEEMALALFDKPEWDAIKGSRIWELSGGQTQRLGIIRAFGASQNLVFMDEPTNNLDKSNRQKVVDFIQKYRRDKSIIFVSHDNLFLDMLNIEMTFEVCEERQRRRKRILQPTDVKETQVSSHSLQLLRPQKQYRRDSKLKYERQIIKDQQYETEREYYKTGQLARVHWRVDGKLRLIQLHDKEGKISEIKYDENGNLVSDKK